MRCTIGPAAQREILDRLLGLDRARFAEGVADGLHGERARRSRPAKDDGALFWWALF